MTWTVETLRASQRFNTVGGDDARSLSGAISKDCPRLVPKYDGAPAAAGSVFLENLNHRLVSETNSQV